MLLLTMNEWIGPGNRWPANKPQPIVRERHMSFATRLPLAQAMEQVLEYQHAYNSHYTMAVNFGLISVCDIPDVNDKILEELRVEIIENLCKSDVFTSRQASQPASDLPA